MLGRFLLSRGGISALQLHRLTISNTARTTVFRGTALSGGNAGGRYSIVQVRHAKSDAEGGKPKKAKKSKKKDLDIEDDMEKFKAKKNPKLKSKKKDTREKDEKREEDEGEVEGKIGADIIEEDKKVAMGLGDSVAAEATGITALEAEASESSPAEPSEPASAAPESEQQVEAAKEISAEPEVSKGEQERAIVRKSTETEVVKVAPEDEIELSPRSEELHTEEIPKSSHSSAPDFYRRTYPRYYRKPSMISKLYIR